MQLKVIRKLESIVATVVKSLSSGEPLKLSLTFFNCKVSFTIQNGFQDSFHS